MTILLKFKVYLTLVIAIVFWAKMKSTVNNIAHRNIFAMANVCQTKPCVMELTIVTMDPTKRIATKLQSGLSKSPDFLGHDYSIV